MSLSKPPITLKDLEYLVEFGIMPDNKNIVDLAPVSIMPEKPIRKQFKFWLDTGRGGELALCQYLDTLKANRKLKPFLILALRYAILNYSTTKHHVNGVPNVPFEYLDDIQADIEYILDHLDWSKE